MKLDPKLLLGYSEEYKKKIKKEFKIDYFQKISVCIMVKNENRCIKRCIDSIYDLSDEIIIVDTGSTDNTIEIASKYSKIRIMEKKWNDDFSEIRNFMINQAKYEWIFQIDADEYINKDDIDTYKDIISIVNFIDIFPKVISPKILDYDNNETYFTFRIFKKEKKLKYFGLIHEELRYNNSADIPMLSIDLAINHDGYKAEIIEYKDKYIRNYILLNNMIQIESDNIRWYFFLIREAMLLKKDKELVEQIIIKSLHISTKTNEYKAGILTKYIELKLDDDPLFALDMIDKAMEEFPNCIDFIYYKLLLTCRNAYDIIDSENKNTINKIKVIDNQYSFIDSNGGHIFEKLGWNYFFTGDIEVAKFFFEQIKNPTIRSTIKHNMKYINSFLRR